MYFKDPFIEMADLEVQWNLLKVKRIPWRCGKMWLRLQIWMGKTTILSP